MASRFAPTPRRKDRQRTLDQARRPTGHGGWRPGAGRKPTGKRVGPAHRARPELGGAHPVHVSLRIEQAVGRLRRRHGYQAAHRAVAGTLARADFRIVHVSLQHNHVHLILEAVDRRALARGMQSFTIAFARRLNQRLGRRGRVVAHRYHATAITGPLQARNCLSYVLNNWRRHREDWRSAAARRAPVDPYSSGPRFDGWRDLAVADALAGLPRDYDPLPTASPTTWLLTVGWRRHRAIATHERPGPWNA